MRTAGRNNAFGAGQAMKKPRTEDRRQKTEYRRIKKDKKMISELKAGTRQS
jgi:hypothetical protein